MTYTITLTANGKDTETYWPGDEESARRHMVEQVVSGKAQTSRLTSEDGTLVAQWPEDAAPA